MSKYATESFNVDHTKLKAPFIRKAGRYSFDGATVSKFDIRFCQPNKEVLSREAMHTIEHLFAEVAHSESKRIIDFSPMGCGTGFYLTYFGEQDVDFITGFILSWFKKCLDIKQIPAQNPVQCGSYKLHSLEEAHKAISNFLSNMI